MSELKLINEDKADRDAICAYIEKTEFLSELDRGEVEYLAERVKVYSASMGTYVLREGNTESCLCIIVEGEIDIFKAITPTEHLKVANIRAGGIIGEMGVIDGEVLSASALAATDSIVLLINGEEFENLVKDNEKLGIKLVWRIAKIISSRLRKTTGLLSDFLDVKRL